MLAVFLPFLSCVKPPIDPRAALKRFPIGIYAVNDPRFLARLKADGFDSFQTYRTDPTLLIALAKEARRQEMRMIASPYDLIHSGLSSAQDWPMDAWYLTGEPDVAKLSSAALQGLSARARAWDPHRPQTFDIGQGNPAKIYGNIGDILLMDWYPVPHKPTDSMADQIDLAMAALPKGKPFWMIIQAYDWADEVKDPVKRRGLRFPSHAEIRFMSYLSVVHGARGLFYFCLPKQGRTLFDYPELWQAVARVALEMRSLQPVFEHGQVIPVPDMPRLKGLEAKAWRWRGRDYVVLLNRRGDVYQKIPNELLARTWRPLFEPRRETKDMLQVFYGAWYLRPYQVLVLESPVRWATVFAKIITS